MRLTSKRAAAAAAGSALVAGGVLVPTAMSQATTTHTDTYFVSATGGGTKVKSFPTTATSVKLPPPFSAGDYRVTVAGITASQCATLANTNTDDGSTATALAGAGNVIIVHTYAQNGAPADRAFDLIVVC